MSTTAIKTQFNSLTQYAVSNINNAPRDLRGIMEPGDAWAQGDLLIRRLASLPGVTPIDPVAQLAPGNTQGSRHCLSSLEDIRMFSLPEFHSLSGPLFQADRDVTITHPEHGHVILAPGLYAIEYQRASDDNLHRVLD